ncbi:MAG: DUF3179 domain-containing protein [Gemmatimonadota bacterium]
MTDFRGIVSGVLAPFGAVAAIEAASPLATLAQSKNGFDLSNASVPVDQIVSGGPPRDGIPALTDPRFETVTQAAAWMRPDDRLLALEIGRQAKAYPLRILNWHEVVNDQVGRRPVLVTYCPLCGTGMAFDPVVRGKRMLFGVSGLLYNSDVLMYDRETESLWSQIARRATSGSLRGTSLELLPLVHTTWDRWRREHPRGLVLSRETGHDRDYDRDPYLQYAAEPGVMFPLGHRDSRLPEKALVLASCVQAVKTSSHPIASAMPRRISAVPARRTTKSFTSSP